MTPSPTLAELIEIVKADAARDDTLGQLAQASRTVSDLEQVSDELLGHFVDQCRRGGHSWSEISAALGVSKQAAHKRFSFGAPAFERFTERARAVLSPGAEEQARLLGHGFVGTEHLLLALFEPAESMAARILSDLGVNSSRRRGEDPRHDPSGQRSARRPSTIHTPCRRGAQRRGGGGARASVTTTSARSISCLDCSATRRVWRQRRSNSSGSIATR